MALRLSSNSGLKRPGFLRAAEQVAVFLALLAGAAVTTLAVLIALDIVGRDIFGVSLQGTDEIGGYVLAFVGSLGMALTLLRRGHPRIDLFFRFFPRKLSDILHVLAQIGIACLAIFMTWHALMELQTTLRFGAVTNTPLQTPLWVPQAIWVFGTAFFAITACLTSAHAVFLLFLESENVVRYYGPVTIDDEVSHYIVDANEESSHARS